MCTHQPVFETKRNYDLEKKNFDDLDKEILLTVIYMI
jgi:hypothetical protein